MGEIHNTQFFKAVQENKMDVSQVLEQVYVALTEKGYNPVNPMRINPPIKNKSWKDYMIDDLRLLFDCEAIYLIDNWQMSKGARIEYYIAKKLGMSIIETIE